MSYLCFHGHADIALYSMRYSRMLEESSFANRKADYFWLLLLSSAMLLVRSSFYSQYSFVKCLPGLISPFQSSILVSAAGICSHICLVTTASLHSYLTLWPFHHHCPVSPCCACCIRMGSERHMESSCGRSGRMCSGPRRLVHAGCVDKGIGRRAYNI